MTTEYGSTMIWVIFLFIGLGAFALRSSFIFFIGRLKDVPTWVEGVLRFVPPAVLAALIVPAVLSLSLEPSLGLTVEPEKLFALALAAAVAWRTENILATISVGMVALWGFQAVV